MVDMDSDFFWHSVGIEDLQCHRGMDEGKNKDTILLSFDY